MGGTRSRAALLAGAWHIAKLSEEHGWVDIASASASATAIPRVGERLRIVPSQALKQPTQASSTKNAAKVGPKSPNAGNI